MEIGEYTVEFGVAYIESAAGKMPVIINLEHKFSSGIAVGKVLMMTALVKANFAVGEGNYRMI